MVNLIDLVRSGVYNGWGFDPSNPTDDRLGAFLPPTPTQHHTTGGNDVISVRSDCEGFNANCLRQIDEAVSIGAGLLQQLHDEGACGVWSG